MGERLINHIDETFESIVGKALRSESLYPKSKTEVASAEVLKPQAGDGGKNNSQNKRKQNQAKDGQKKKNKQDVECFSCGKKGHYARIVGPSQRIGSASTVVKWDISRISVCNLLRRSRL